MPNIKSAKNVKVIATKTLRNKAINTALKTDIKKKQTLHLKIKTQIQLRLLKLQSEQLIKLLQKVFFIRILLPEKNLRLHKSLTLLTHNCYA